MRNRWQLNDKEDDFTHLQQLELQLLIYQLMHSRIHSNVDRRSAVTLVHAMLPWVSRWALHTLDAQCCSAKCSCGAFLRSSMLSSAICGTSISTIYWWFRFATCARVHVIWLVTFFLVSVGRELHGNLSLASLLETCVHSEGNLTARRLACQATNATPRGSCHAERMNYSTDTIHKRTMFEQTMCQSMKTSHPWLCHHHEEQKIHAFRTDTTKNQWMRNMERITKLWCHECDEKTLVQHTRNGRVCKTCVTCCYKRSLKSANTGNSWGSTSVKAYAWLPMSGREICIFEKKHGWWMCKTAKKFENSGQLGQQLKQHSSAITFLMLVWTWRSTDSLFPFSISVRSTNCSSNSTYSSPHIFSIFHRMQHLL